MNCFVCVTKRYWLPGSTLGIGQTISLRFAQAGATLIANYLHNEQAAEKLKSAGQEKLLSITLCRAGLTSDRCLEQLNGLLQEAASSLSGMILCRHRNSRADRG
jgi:NAD(P)-dependent dehydrogenase (short-subunit alcohol dehydrogenase family)